MRIPNKMKISQSTINSVSCCIVPSNISSNKYIDLMKMTLCLINVKPVSEENINTADFVWFHWIEGSYENSQLLYDIKNLAISGKKIIWNFHNKIPHETKDIQKAKEFMKTMADIAYKIVVHCGQSTKIIQELCGENSDVLNKIVFVPHPYYTGAYGVEKTENSLCNDKLQLCFFGQIRSYKNIELLISVINELNFDDIEINIAGFCGSEEYARYLKNLIGKNKNIKTDFRFIDDREIPEISANCHLFILPYNLDSSLNSGATILAFSYARSVISSLTGTLADIKDKSLFFAYSYNDEAEHKEELKKQIIAIREKYKGNYNELLRLGEKCKEYVNENNSFVKVGKQLEKIFNADFHKEKSGDERIKNLTSYDNDVNKETKNPLVRVFVSTYNHVRYIRYCLNGILMQKTDFPFEIYISDDCSTDGTSDIVREYAERYANIIADIHTGNYYGENMELWRKKSLINMKNHNCKYLSFCEGDDYWIDPHKLQVQVDFLENHNDFSICSGGALLSYAATGAQNICLRSMDNLKGFQYDFSAAYVPVVLVNTATCVYRTNAIPGYEIAKKYKYWRDAHFNYYILTKGKGYYLSRLFAVYNRHETGIYAGLNPYEQCEINYKVFEELYRETRDKQVKYNFILKFQSYIINCLRTEEQRIVYCKKLIETFPEAGGDILADKNIFNLFLKDILQRFQEETSLCRETYERLIEEAQSQNIIFTAQFAQDVMAYLFFCGKKDGFYIEIGANDGYNGSTTFFAQQLGWKGICIEPQKETFERLQKYRNCALYNFAISDKTRKDVEFITFPERDFRSGIADTMSDSHIEEAKKLSSMSTATINTVTFGDMMKDFPDVKHIDFLSIDTEGHEMNVLRSIDFDKYSFGLITIETEENSDVVEFVEQKGYKPLLTAGSDVIFVPKNYRIEEKRYENSLSNTRI